MFKTRYQERKLGKTVGNFYSEMTTTGKVRTPPNQYSQWIIIVKGQERCSKNRQKREARYKQCTHVSIT
jgi:hypothetical protein